MHFATFADVTAHLDRLGLFHMDFGLERMHQALDALHLRRQGVLARPMVQIVGTNGKGSTAHFLASIAERHGLRVGLYTSPHLVSVAERIRLGGLPLPEADWPGLADRVYAACPELTYFEFLTVLAVLAFSQASVDCMILEAGLGGRYDATTAVEADLVCFTPVALDHMQVLGPDLATIATDKSGAMRPGVPALTAPQAAEALDALSRTARERGCELVRTPLAPPGPLGLRGPHQRLNAGLALAAWRRLALLRGWQTDTARERQGLAEAFIPGRLQRADIAGLPPLLLDGSHNEHGLKALLRALRAENLRPRAVVFTCMADKDTAALLPLVRSLNVPIFVPGLAGNSRAAEAPVLAGLLGACARACPDVAEALRQAAAVPAPVHAPLLVCGSLYLLGAFFRLHPEFLTAKRPGMLDEPAADGHIR